MSTYDVASPLARPEILVRSLQPDTLIDGRLGAAGDYVSTGDIVAGIGFTILQVAGVRAYTRKEVVERLRTTLRRGNAIIAALRLTQTTL